MNAECDILKAAVRRLFGERGTAMLEFALPDDRDRFETFMWVLADARSTLAGRDFVGLGKVEE